MKKILGLDLGTNSIGWALVDKENKKILGMGSRIIPMSQDILGEFGKGNSVSQTAERTGYRGVRRIRERHLLRRERLHRVLNVLGFLPEHYAAEIDFDKHFGQFKEETEPKLVWKKNGKKENGKDKFEFLFQKSFNEMIEDFKKTQPDLLNRKKKNGEDVKIPYDWTIYYLRKKALTRKIEKEELAWLILNFNQKRGYYQARDEEEKENPNKLVEFHSLKVVEVRSEIRYNLTLENGKIYYRLSDTPLFDWKDTNRDFTVTTYLEKDGTVKKDKDGKEQQSFFLKDDLAVIKSKKIKSRKTKSDIKVEEKSIKIVDVKEEEQDELWYSLVLENGWVYRRSSKISLLEWKDKVRDFIVTTDLNDDGTIKKDEEGKEKRSFRAPGEDDWTLLKKKTENDLDMYIKEYKTKNGIDGTIGSYIYDTLLINPIRKIKGKLVSTIERKFYKDELRQILQKQIKLQPQLFTDNLYNDCVRELYRNNEAHQLTLSKRDFVHLFLDDIIFYQRPLRSQKSSIGNCSLEFRLYKIYKKDEKGNPIKNVFEKDENGKDLEVKEYLKVIPKSHPLYQEFRLWQWIYNLSIYKKDDDSNVTQTFLNNIEDYEKLFEFLNKRKEIEQKPLIKYFIELCGLKGKALNSEVEKYRWNFVEDKKYPCNETRTLISTRLAKVESLSDNFLTDEIEEHLWHIIYSVTDKIEYEKALKTFAERYGLEIDSFVDSFIKFPPFKSEYGSYSAKAIKKLLPLMRIGKYWNWDNIDEKTKNRISKIITGEYDEDIKNKVREKAINLTTEKHFHGLQLWLASYIVYGRHSEASTADKWDSVSDLENYLKEFKQHSLRNPIVEQVVTETLRVVKDIWQQYGNGKKDFFDEIHVELGREMKNTAEDRKKISEQVIENESTNLRIKALLAELNNDTSIENVRPYSLMQQETLKIFEDGVLSSDIEIPDDIIKISKTAQPSSSELQRYKLWLEQKYRSPYTGEMIPLGKLFTTEYEIEHIIPQSRYFDDSFNNKVICESAVNKLKDNQIGFEFIKNHHGETVETGFGKNVKVFEINDYEDFVKTHYAKSRSKRNKLLMEDIPEKMIERQINDTRYISKFISSILSNIVRAEKDDDGINSKNLIPGNGKITTILKQDWGLNDVWNDLILPRFERMNEVTNSKVFTEYNTKYQKYLPTVPLEYSKKFQKKRIDHRHHALDALVIACATRDHVNLLNNKYAKSNTRYDLNRKLRNFEKVVYTHPRTKEKIERDIPKEFLKPWDSFTVDTKNYLESIVISFKQNIRVINKATNVYQKWVKIDDRIFKKDVRQLGKNWSIRKPLHKETVSGKVELKRIKVPKDKILTATRKSLDTSFDLKTIASITDTGIQKILINYLSSKENNPELAFSPEGIEDMNKNIALYNDGTPHQPIYKVRIFELGSKFPLGETRSKKYKYVEAAKGTNLFFAIYQDEEGKRNYETIPLNIVIERQKQGLSSVPEINDKGNRLLFHLSPNDLVYVPTEEESINQSIIDFSNLSKVQKQRLYNVNDFSSTCYFTPNYVAKAIAPKEVDLNYDSSKNKIIGSFDTKTASLNGIQIKDYCIKLNVDRLGNISKAKQ